MQSLTCAYTHTHTRVHMHMRRAQGRASALSHTDTRVHTPTHSQREGYREKSEVKGPAVVDGSVGWWLMGEGRWMAARCQELQGQHFNVVNVSFFPAELCTFKREERQVSGPFPGWSEKSQDRRRPEPGGNLCCAAHGGEA